MNKLRGYELLKKAREDRDKRKAFEQRMVNILAFAWGSGLVYIMVRILL